MEQIMQETEDNDEMTKSLLFNGPELTKKLMQGNGQNRIFEENVQEGESLSHTDSVDENFSSTENENSGVDASRRFSLPDKENATDALKLVQSNANAKEDGPSNRTETKEAVASEQDLKTAPANLNSSKPQANPSVQSIHSENAVSQNGTSGIADLKSQVLNVNIDKNSTENLITKSNQTILEANGNNTISGAMENKAKFTNGNMSELVNGSNSIPENIEALSENDKTNKNLSSFENGISNLHDKEKDLLAEFRFLGNTSISNEISMLRDAVEKAAVFLKNAKNSTGSKKSENVKKLTENIFGDHLKEIVSNLERSLAENNTSDNNTLIIGKANKTSLAAKTQNNRTGNNNISKEKGERIATSILDKKASKNQNSVENVTSVIGDESKSNQSHGNISNTSNETFHHRNASSRVEEIIKNDGTKSKNTSNHLLSENSLAREILNNINDDIKTMHMSKDIRALQKNENVGKVSTKEKLSANNDELIILNGDKVFKLKDTVKGAVLDNKPGEKSISTSDFMEQKQRDGLPLSNRLPTPLDDNNKKRSAFLGYASSKYNKSMVKGENTTVISNTTSGDRIKPSKFSAVQISGFSKEESASRCVAQEKS